LNVDQFFNYLENRFDEKFATFICEDLQIITPCILTVWTTKELVDLTHNVYPDLNSSSVQYYIGDHADKNGKHEVKHSIMTLIQLLKKELSHDQRKKRKTNFLNTSSQYQLKNLRCFISAGLRTALTTSSEMSDGEVYINNGQINTFNDKLIEKGNRVIVRLVPRILLRFLICTFPKD
jgi:hypothetical protein